MVEKVTIYGSVFDKKPYYITVGKAIERIRDGASAKKISELRATIDEERQDSLKKNLPAVSFSGEFSARGDSNLIKHSGYMILDFDHIHDVEEKKRSLMSYDFVFAAWVSPRNNGVKALVRIADKSKHTQHYDAIKEIFPDVDEKCRNVERLCFESWDPAIMVNEKAKKFTKTVITEKVEVKTEISDDREVFDKLLKWMSNKGKAFVKGDRNNFVFLLSTACCRFGISEESCISLCLRNFSVGQDSFGINECKTTVRSGYKRAQHEFGTAHFEKGQFVDKKTSREIEINEEMFDDSVRPKDVIYAIDVKEDGLRIYDRGYERINGIGVYEIDRHYKMKEGEITLLTGYGNYGKSSLLKWYILMRVLKFGEKFAFFSPEDFAQDFYLDLVETLLGCDCTISNKDRPRKDVFNSAWDYIDKHIFFVYPQDLSPTPDYIKQRFLELIIKEGVKGVVIDPFNQMLNDYGPKGGRSDRYLDTFLSDYSRFCRQNSVYGLIVAHPRRPDSKGKDGNYSCPTVFEIADGAMWNNKMDNILVYHRPEHETNPHSDICEFHAKKIRRQKVVGQKGYSTFNYSRPKRRYLFGGKDPLQTALDSGTFQFHNSKGVQSSLIDNFDNFDPVNLEDSPF